MFDDNVRSFAMSHFYFHFLRGGRPPPFRPLHVPNSAWVLLCLLFKRYRIRQCMIDKTVLNYYELYFVTVWCKITFCLYCTCLHSLSLFLSLPLSFLWKVDWPLIIYLLIKIGVFIYILTSTCNVLWHLLFHINNNKPIAC